MADVDLEKFFAAMRKDTRLGVKKLTQMQVDCASRIITLGTGLRRDALAYVLATAWGEAKLTPTRENLNYTPKRLILTFGSERVSPSQAELLGRKPGKPADQRAIANLVYGGEWGLKNLGNIKPDDGWVYRGGGLDQLTGRANYRKRGLENTPEKILEPEVAARSLIVGMTLGDYRGFKLTDFFTATTSDFVGARSIVNADGSTNGVKYARYAEAFRDALSAAGYVASTPPAKDITTDRKFNKPTASALQKELAALGLYGKKIDGIWGPASEAALTAYQSAAERIAALLEN